MASSMGIDLAKIFSNNKQSEISVRDRTFDRNPHCVHNKKKTHDWNRANLIIISFSFLINIRWQRKTKWALKEYKGGECLYTVYSFTIFCLHFWLMIC